MTAVRRLFQRLRRLPAADHPFGTVCACCESGILRPFEECQGADGHPALIRQCIACGVLTRQLDDMPDDSETQAAGLEEVYASYLEDADAVQAGVAASAAMLSDLLGRIATTRRAVFLEIGAGAGHMSLAATREFRHVYATDLRPDLLGHAARLHGSSDKVTVGTGLEVLPPSRTADIVFMWHTLEHVPRSLQMLEALFARTAASGTLLLQVPAYRPAYVIPEHWHYHNEYSLRYVLTKAGFTECRILFDLSNSFITAIATKG